MIKDFNITTKINPEFLKNVTKDIILALEKKCSVNTIAEFEDCDLIVQVKYREKKKGKK